MNQMGMFKVRTKIGASANSTISSATYQQNHLTNHKEGDPLKQTCEEGAWEKDRDSFLIHNLTCTI